MPSEDSEFTEEVDESIRSFSATPPKAMTIRAARDGSTIPFDRRYKLENLGTRNPDWCLLTPDNFAFPVSRAALEAHAAKYSCVFWDIGEEVIDLNGSAVSVPTVLIGHAAAQVKPLLLHISPQHYTNSMGLAEMLDIYHLSRGFDMESVLNAMRDKLR